MCWPLPPCWVNASPTPPRNSSVLLYMTDNSLTTTQDNIFAANESYIFESCPSLILQWSLRIKIQSIFSHQVWSSPTFSRISTFYNASQKVSPNFFLKSSFCKDSRQLCLRRSRSPLSPLISHILSHFSLLADDDINDYSGVLTLIKQKNTEQCNSKKCCYKQYC